MMLHRALLILLAALALGGAEPRAASAQAWDMIEERQDRQIRERGASGGGLLDMLFGNRRRERPASSDEPTRRTGTAATEISRPQAVVKDDNAGVVVVIGDTMGSQMALGLADVFANETSIVVEDRTDGPSGLVRTDYRNWFDSVPDILTTPRLAAVVVVMGINDGQAVRTDEGEAEKGSDAWISAYRTRISALALALSPRGVPVIWAGLPPVRADRLMETVMLVNRLTREGTLGTPVTFVDVFPSFADAGGHFIESGPDMEGRLTRLRSSDGIHFNTAGRLRYAHFVEGFIPRTANQQRLAALGITSAVYQGASLSEGGIGPVVSLEAAPLAGFRLLDDADAVRPREEAARLRLVEGEALPAQAGRADDFVWPPRNSLPQRPAIQPAQEFDGL